MRKNCLRQAPRAGALGKALPALRRLGHGAGALQSSHSLLLDPAGSARASNQTSPLYLGAHTPKSYFQKQREHLGE